MSKFLQWLPVQSLMRFTSVCKFWCAHIQTPTFNAGLRRAGTGIIGMHRLHRLSWDTDHFFLLNAASQNFEVPIDLHLPYFKEDYFKQEEYFIKWKEQFQGKYLDPGDIFLDKEVRLEIVGVCNGIVCLYDRKCADISFRNPATRELRLLPQSSTVPPPKRPPESNHYLPPFGETPLPSILKTPIVCNVCGFGYDVKTQDLKLLRTIPTYTPKPPEPFELYSLASDSWKRIYQPLPLHNVFFNSYPKADVNGILYWLAFPPITSRNVSDHKELLLSFDLTNEKFQTMQLPDECTNTNYCNSLSVLNETLALILYTRNLKAEPSCEIWVLYEYGVKESWTKLYKSGSIPVPPRPWPLGFSKNAEFLLCCTNDTNGKTVLALCNRATQQIKHVQLQGRLYYLDLVAYKESLLSIKGLNHATEISQLLG